MLYAVWYEEIEPGNPVKQISKARVVVTRKDGVEMGADDVLSLVEIEAQVRIFTPLLLHIQQKSANLCTVIKGLSGEAPRSNTDIILTANF